MDGKLGGGKRVSGQATSRSVYPFNIQISMLEAVCMKSAGEVCLVQGKIQYGGGEQSMVLVMCIQLIPCVFAE